MPINLINEPGRVFARDAAGKVIAEVTFPKSGDGLVNINHTFVDPSLRGQGAADKLMSAAVASIRTDGLKAVATCSYAVKWFEKNPDQRDVLS